MTCIYFVAVNMSGHMSNVGVHDYKKARMKLVKLASLNASFYFQSASGIHVEFISLYLDLP